MNKEHLHFTKDIEHWLEGASLFWRRLPFGRWAISLAIVFTFAGCAATKPSPPPNAVQQFSSLPMCSKSDTGRGAIYFFDGNDVLYSVAPQESPAPNPNWKNTNPGFNINHKDASTLIRLNEKTNFVFHGHVSNWYTEAAVFALIDDPYAACPTYKCVYQAKETKWLKRDLDEPEYKECGEKSCPHGAFPCGGRLCCYP
jgi:hypothetical protein